MTLSRDVQQLSRIGWLMLLVGVVLIPTGIKLAGSFPRLGILPVALIGAGSAFSAAGGWKLLQYFLVRRQP